MATLDDQGAVDRLVPDRDGRVFQLWRAPQQAGPVAAHARSPSSQEVGPSLTGGPESRHQFSPLAASAPDEHPYAAGASVV